MTNPCKESRCEQLCLLAPKVSNPLGFTCMCRPGYRLGDDGSCIEKDDPFLMVIKENEIIDLNINSEDKNNGHFTPVVDIKYGISVDYDVKKQEVFWTETEGAGQTNATLYRFVNMTQSTFCCARYYFATRCSHSNKALVRGYLIISSFPKKCDNFECSNLLFI